MGSRRDGRRSKNTPSIFSIVFYTYFISLYTFLSTKLHILHSFYNTRILLYLYTFLSTKLHILHSFYTRILLYLYLCSVFCTFISGLFSFPMKHLSLLSLPNYSNSQFTYPFYHPNIHWIPIHTSTSVDIHSNSQPISSFPIGPYPTYSNFLVIILIPILPIPTLVNIHLGFL